MSKLIPVVFMCAPLGDNPQPIHPRDAIGHIVRQAMLATGHPTDDRDVAEAIEHAVLLFGNQLHAWHLDNKRIDRLIKRDEAAHILEGCLRLVASLPCERVDLDKYEAPATLTEAKAA